MLDAPILLEKRYTVLETKRINKFERIFFVLDTHQTPSRSCVVQTFKPIANKPEIVQWIDREFTLTANLLQQISSNNSYLPKIYRYFRSSRNYYLVRESIAGQTLQQIVEKTGKLSIPEVRTITVKLLSVLNYIHEQEIIHQNIQPQNIVLRQQDRVPILLDFGDIGQIVATSGFCGYKQIFSIDNISGYASSEQVLGKPIPATDLYSLGLTAIYLLTGKNPVDLAIESNSGNFKIPGDIARLDPDLAKILARAINTDSSNRYHSAREMLDDLLQEKFASGDLQAKKDEAKSVCRPKSNYKTKPKNWCKTGIYWISGACATAMPIVAWYNWQLNQNAFVPALLESENSPPKVIEASEKLAASITPTTNEPLQNQLDIPSYRQETSSQELQEILGKPDSIQNETDSNNSTWIYKNLYGSSVNIAYLFDLDTKSLQRTKATISDSLNLATADRILANLLQDNITPSISQALEKVYLGQASQYLFRLENLEVTIKREQSKQSAEIDEKPIYVEIWNLDVDNLVL